jgi:hypothetical protein
MKVFDIKRENNLSMKATNKNQNPNRAISRSRSIENTDDPNIVISK